MALGQDCTYGMIPILLKQTMMHTQVRMLSSLHSELSNSINGFLRWVGGISGVENLVSSSYPSSGPQSVGPVQRRVLYCTRSATTHPHRCCTYFMWCNRSPIQPSFTPYAASTNFASMRAVTSKAVGLDTNWPCISVATHDPSITDKPRRKCKTKRPHVRLPFCAV